MKIIRPCIQEFISGYRFCSTDWHICLYASQLPQWLSWWRICLHCRRHRRCSSIHGLIRSPGEGNGNPVQYSWLRNPLDRGAWWATVQKVTKSQEDWVTKHTFFAKSILFWFLYICSMFWNQRPPALLFFVRWLCLFGGLWDSVLTVGWIFYIWKKIPLEF